MQLPEDQIQELKTIAPDLSVAEEGGFTYILIKNLILPDGCSPAASDVLLCPMARDGYESRLFFPNQITGGPQRNWNGNIRVLEKNWYAFSWKVQRANRLAEALLMHLKGLRK